MKSQITGIVFSWLVAAGIAVAANPPSILPAPQKLVVGAGQFKLTPATRICTDAASRATGEYLATQLRQSTGHKFKVIAAKKGAVKGDILITTANAKTNLGAEGYELNVATDSVVIRAPEPAGGFYGVQTLLQLLPPEVFAAQPVKGVAWTMPCVQIEDQPRFKWRGMLLDVARHFFSKAEVKKVFDELALHKLNTLHWHLTDDCGWRIEIKKYPKLTEISAWRDGIGFGLDPKASTAYRADGLYGGFYTQEDIRELVAYAAERHITIVPTIEMPGHCGSATDVYPELNCVPSTNQPTGAAEWVAPGGGVARGIFCAGQERTFEFLQDVLVEVMALFPGKYVHIGGDEANRGAWQKCVHCQARLQAEGLKDVNALQDYFLRRMEKFIVAKGRAPISWGHTPESGLAQPATFMDWLGGAEAAASAGHDVVMAPYAATYFDYYQADPSSEPRAIGGYLTLRHAYEFEPLPAKLDPKFRARILGAQGNLWTEFIPSLKHLEYMTFPRLSALAEVTWSPKEARSWEDFNRRLPVQFQRFGQLGINYRRLGNDQRLDRSNQPKDAINIGEWTPAQMTGPAGALEWDVTPQLTVPGQYRVDLNYTHGAHGLNVTAVSLLEDGVVLVRKARETFTGLADGYAVYLLDLPVRKAGANYRVRAEANLATGTNSFGQVFWSPRPSPKTP